MRPLQITLFIMAFVFLSGQIFRHINVKFFAQKTSVLDQYDEQVEKDIKTSQTLDELVAIYEQKKENIKKYEADANNKKIKPHERHSVEPYKSQFQAEEAIKTWEEHDHHIKKLRFYWFCGFLSILIGMVTYIKIDRWVGLAAVITGFTEMIFWTSPRIIGFSGSRHEFEKLLTNKLIFSIISLVLLLVVWFALYKVQGKHRD
ncbi:MAG: hypothetical protein KGV50_04355 [Gammaproteobacteria bacterium]|nr:hypothetical protein [Gammaproteobacteria bacterium]